MRKLYKAAKDVVVHADETSFVFKDADGKETNVSAEDFARILKEDQGYKGGPVRLIACDAGKDGAITARAFAKALGKPVMAAKGQVEVYPDGEMRVTGDETGLIIPDGWIIIDPTESGR